MSIASRHGKLSSSVGNDEDWWTRQEDLLTADVFGAYRYLPAELGLLPFLRRAINLEGRTLAEWAGAATWDALTHAEVIFWPAFGAREPDLLLALRCEQGEDLLVLVEAKLGSPQHGIEGCSQVGYYGRRLLSGDFDEDVIEGDLPVRRTLVYLTKAIAPPAFELEQARRELEQHAGADVFWLSWHHAREAAEEAVAEQEGIGRPHVLALLRDLVEDLTARGFATPRERVPWPLELPAPLDRRVERWLEPRQLVIKPLLRIEDTLRDWSLR